MRMITVATILLVVFAVWFMVVRIKGFSKKDVVLKMVAAVSFVTISGTALVLKPSVMGGYLLAGAVFGALGDLYLGLSHILKEKKKHMMFAGIFNFGMGHICFCQGLLHQYSTGDSLKYVLAAFAVGAAFAAVLGFGGRKMGLHFGRYFPVVLIYVFLLTFSVALALGFNVYHGWETVQLKLFMVGITCFIISDGILSRMYFGKLGNAPGAVIWNHVTYYVAQWFIAISILYI